MNASPRLSRHRPAHFRSGFTLVEILVVIVIISILMGLAIPAVTIAINRGKVAKMKMEVDAISSAIEQYQQKYGDYPPDFSSWTVIERHYRKIFPRIGTGELQRLRLLLDTNTSNDTLAATTSAAAHNAVALDRGEVIAWTLGGYSSNPLIPFTGPGGPLEEIGDKTSLPVEFQINLDRDNKLYDFDPARFDLSKINASATITLSNRYISSDGDLFASYSAKGAAPFVYFDSRTYALFDVTLGQFNGYGSTTHGLVRPYFSDKAVAKTNTSNYTTLAAALGAWQFAKPDTFQIVAPGIDEHFGLTAAYEVDSSNPGAEPLYFQYATGAAIVPSTMDIIRPTPPTPPRPANSPGGLIILGVNGYQERSVFGAAENYQLDNITNFSNAQIIDDVP